MLNRKFLKLGLILLFSINYSSSFSQCCSAGSPVGASMQVGIIEKNTLRVNTSYRNSLNKSYFQGLTELNDFGFIDHTFFNYTSLLVGYGLTHKLTLDADFGFFVNKTQVFKTVPEFTLRGRGFSSGVISLKRAIYNSINKGVEVTAGVGLKIPFAFEDQYYNNVLLPVELQPSTGAFGAMIQLFIAKSWCENERRLFTYNKLDYNLKNKNNYRYGWSMINSIFYSHKIVKGLILAGELRNEYRTNDFRNNEAAINTGSHLIVFSPKIMYSIAGKWNVSVLYDLPIYRYYTGRQMGIYRSFAMNLTRDFKL